MKKLDLLTQYLAIMLLALTTFGLVSCNSEQNETTTKETKIAKLLQRGDAIQLGKEWDEVQNSYNDFKNAISKDPNNNKAKIQLAQLYIREARVTGEHGHYYPGALNILDDAISNQEIKDDLRFLALTTKAGVQLSLHEFSDAMKTGNQAALLNPNNAQIHGVLVDANVELGNYTKAVKLADRMLAIKPDIRSYSRASYLREIHGDVEGSIEAMIMAVKAGYPGNEETAWAMLTLGDIYQQYGELDKAQQVYKEILDMRPNYPFAVGAIGDIQAKKGMDEEAEATYKEAMEIIPEVGFYVSLAELYKKQERNEEMQGLLDEIFVMLKEDTDSGHNMNLEYADIHLNILENPDKAMEYALLEYKKRPKNIDVNRMMAKIHVAKNDKEAAKQYFEVAQKTSSKHPEISELEEAINS